MKKLLLALLVLSLSVSLAACSGNDPDTTTSKEVEVTREPTPVSTDDGEDEIEYSPERDLYGLGSFVEYASDDQFDYIIYENGAAVSGYKGSSESVTLPTAVAGKDTAVTAVARYAFDGASVKKIAVPEGYTTIGSCAFFNCEVLESVSLPSSLTTLSDGAFMLDVSLKSVTIPDSVTTLGTKVFYGCESLEFCGLPNGTTAIPESFFFGCTSLRFEIPETVKTLGKSAFYYCTSLTNITIPENVVAIGEKCFYYCTNVTTLSLPDGLKNIGAYAFYKNSGISSVSIPSNVNSIGAYAFFGLDKITSVAFPEGLSAIGDGAFGECASLASVTLPEKVKSISAFLFYGCENLSSVSYSAEVKSIGNGAFTATAITSFTMPENVASIGSYTFKNCKSLSSIDFGEKVASIGTEAFTGCTSLTNVTIPAQLSSVGDSAFSGCTSLVSVTLTDGVQKLNKYSFYNCPLLKSMNVPESVTSVGAYALGYLEGEVVVGDPEPDPIAIEGYKITGYLGGSANSLEKYAKEYPVSEFVVLGNIGEAPYSDFEYELTANGLVITKYLGDDEEVILPTYIRMNAEDQSIDFYGVNRRIYGIGESAFAGNTKITTVVVSEKLEVIQKDAFNGCSNLKTVDLEKTALTSIGDRAFLNTKVYNVSLPSTVEELGEYAICIVYQDGEYIVAPNYDEVTITVTKKKVEVTDAEGNTVYEEDGKTPVTTEIEVESSKTTTIKHSVKGLKGSVVEQYAKQWKMSFTSFTIAVVTTEDKK